MKNNKQKIKEALDNPATGRNSMGASESYYNSHYMVGKCFTPEELEKMSDTELETLIKDEKDSYKKRFTDWKKEILESVAKTKDELDRYKKVQSQKIEEKKQIIDEIEKGISSLKEMSKEHKE